MAPASSPVRTAGRWVSPLPTALSFILPAAAAFVRPFGLDVTQSVLLGVLLQVIAAWSAGFVRRELASGYLLVCFLLVGEAAPAQVFTFPLSSNFVLIAASFLLSAAITNSGLADRLAALTFSRFTRSPRDLVRFSFAAGIAFVFLVPQPFPRTVIMASLYTGFLAGKPLPEREKSALLFSIFAASTVTSMLFLSGDVVLNNAALGLAGTSLSFVGWIVMMFVPSAVLTVALYAAFIAVFRIGKEPFPADTDPASRSEPASARSAALTAPERKAAIVTAAVILLWLAEPLHGVPAAWSAAAAVAALFALRVLRLRDLKELNPSLVLFLTAAFSIGKVLSANGIGGVLNAHLFRLLPPPASALYFTGIAIFGMILHMVLGSSVTTLSIVIPSLVLETQGTVPAVTTALLAYVIVSTHYLLPIHHVTVMIGAGKGYYSQRETLTFGLVLSLLVPAAAALLYIPWWRVIGAL